LRIKRVHSGKKTTHPGSVERDRKYKTI